MSAPFSAGLLRDALTRLGVEPAIARLCIAFSGGVDSTALMIGMRELRRAEPSMQVRAIHVNHHLLAQADAWAGHCREVARQLDVSLSVLDAQVVTGAGISVEAAARDARYALLGSQLQQGEVLLTAHHQDDQLETLLLQLMRGAGVAGLASMPQIAPFGEGLHARPLLGFTRLALEDFVRGAGVRWIDDTSNADVRFDRNYLRAHVLPAVRERWPSAAANASRSAAHLAEAQNLLDDLARQDLSSALDGEALRVAALAALEAPRARNLLRYWMRQAGVRMPSTVKLQDILRQMVESREDASPCIEWADARVRRRRGRIYLERIET